jgi:Flp pilus assembly protein TadD
MKNNVSFKLAASTLVLALTVVGCKPAGSANRVATASAGAPKNEANAGKLFEQAQIAVQKSDIPGALSLIERAVELSPRDVGYRTLLGDLYLKSGRFVSAEQAFSDVLQLHPEDSRATLSLALAQIAQGKAGEAIRNLEGVALEVPADAGLAFALAGQPQRAIQLLEPVARSAGAPARVRQNLALAYAVAGDWQKARITASQDLPAHEVARRMEQWASFANPMTTHLQVATLLGTSPVQDSGQPARLALAPAAPEQPVYAEAEAPAAAEYAAVAAEAPAAAPVMVAAAQPVEAFNYSPPEHGDAFAEPAAVALVDLPASAGGEPAKTISNVQFAAAVTGLVKTPEPILRAVAPAARVAPAPVRAFVPETEAPKRRVGLGRFVVQIGAYRTQAQAEKAWSQAIRRYRLVREPMSTTVSIPGRGTFHRLAIAGFQNPLEANKRCGEIRSRGGNCFVRANAGDAPVRWASRYSGRNA